MKFKLPFGSSVCFGAGLGLLLVACGSNNTGTEPGSTGFGGVTGTGGSVGVGSNPGGSNATGGSTATSGSKTTGGAPSTGGTKAMAGAASTGGVPSTGGTKATGGAVSTGGAASTSTCDNFSFFVTSLVAMRRESGSTNGFGGNLGGLTGADELCRTIAESSLACAGQKTWRAFLSTTTVNAIDRVGTGPWYDRLGRKVANNTTDLLNTRPANADSTIKNDLPNELGVPNHNPDGTGQVDNHDTLTGSNSQGKLYGATATCSDWTSTTASGKPRVGHSWPGGPSQDWMNAMDASGCAAGVNLLDNGAGSGSSVGSGGGYGGIYCFATTP